MLLFVVVEQETRNSFVMPIFENSADANMMSHVSLCLARAGSCGLESRRGVPSVRLSVLVRSLRETVCLSITQLANRLKMETIRSLPLRELFHFNFIRDRIT